MKAENLLNIHQVLNDIGKCVALQFAEACDRDCVRCTIAKEAREAGTAIDEVIDILKAMKNGMPKKKPNLSVNKAWGLTSDVAKEVAMEALKALGLEDRNIVNIDVRADYVVCGVVATLTEVVDVGDETQVFNYSYVSKQVKWRFDDYLYRRTI